MAAEKETIPKSTGMTNSIGVSQDSPPSDQPKNDPIADGLLRLCAVINGTWSEILASIQSISLLREAALYIDCTILSIWKHKRLGETKEVGKIIKICSGCSSIIREKDKICPICGLSQSKIIHQNKTNKMTKK